MCIRTASAPRTSTKIGTVPLEAHDLKKLRSKGTLRGNGKTLEDARTVVFGVNGSDSKYSSGGKEGSIRYV